MDVINNVIYILSYEDWGNMKMSKHHYAIELAKMGNQVFFINHSDRRYRLKRGEMTVLQTEYPNLFSVNHRIWYPYFLKYKFRVIYNILTKYYVRNLIKKIAEIPNVVWSFDTGNSLPLKYFTTGALKIYMPVDGPFGTIHEEKAVESVDLIVSVTDRILKPYAHSGIPRLRINHGVADYFITDEIIEFVNEPIRIGYSGSLLRNDLDINTFIDVIENHRDKFFEFWGECELNKSIIHLPQDVSQSTLKFIEKLRNLPNVVLHGPVSPDVLAQNLKRMDALLICYKIQNDQNHHKVLEYLGSGKVVISSFMSSYESEDPDLLEMLNDEISNNDFLKRFDVVMKNLTFFNSEFLQNKRITYAQKYTYRSQISRIFDNIPQKSNID